MVQYRQGDLLFIKVMTLPREAKKLDSLVIQFSDVTGHSHKLDKGKVYRQWNTSYIVVEEGACILHEEHATLVLDESGIYEVRRQREFGAENVRD